MDTADQYDAVVILGCGVNEDGTLPSAPKESVAIAADLYKAGKTGLIILSGNVSYKATYKPAVSESQAMYAYAQEIGVPAASLLAENESKDTLGNVYFTKIRYLIPRGVRRIVVIPSPSHSFERVQYLFTKVLGDDFTITILKRGANSNKQDAREQASLAIIKEWLDAIPNGDQDAIYQIMRTRHPGYSSNPQKAWNDLQKKIEQFQPPRQP